MLGFLSMSLGAQRITQTKSPEQNPSRVRVEKKKSSRGAEGKLFKGQQQKKTIPPNRHGKMTQIRNGKRVINPSKVTGEMDSDREMTKFINHCNEMKAATAANKEGGQLSIVKTPQESGNTTKR